MKKMMITAVISILCSLVLFTVVFSGCGLPYNAELLDNVYRYENLGECLSADFLEENRLRFAIYDDVGSLDDSFPISRTFVIKSQEEFDGIFITEPEEMSLDFENQMLIIYTFTATNIREISIKDIVLEENILKIHFEREGAFRGANDTCTPYQRYLFVKMDKLDFDSVEVELTEAPDRLF